MLPYERIVNVLDGKPTDILPYIDGFSSMEAAVTFFGPNVLRGNWEDIALLEAELFQSDWIIIPAPLNIPGQPGIFCDIIVEDETHILARTFFGGVWYWRKRPYYAKAVYNPVRFEDDFEKIPDPDWEALRKRVKRLREPVKKLKDRGYFVTMEGKGSFEAAWMLFRGLEETWIDIIERPDLVKSMSDRAVDAVIKLGLMVADECEVDGIWITDDLGTQHAPYFSPQVYRDLFKENHRKLVEAFHEKGLRMTFHSHGNVMAFFDDFVEVGFDSIDPLDEYDGIDLKVLKKRYGDKTTLKGGISCTIGHMKPAEIEHHVREIARIGGSERFILSSAGGVPPEMPLESFNTYRSIIQMVRRGT